MPHDVPFLERRPHSIAMVGLGPSANAFWLEAAAWNTNIPWQEVWVVNRAASAFAHTACFNMHDLRALILDAPQEDLRLRKAETPIITPKAYPEYPMSVEYPIQQVLDFLKDDLLSSTPAYMLAYAMLIGVKEIFFYGMDFHYDNIPQAEKGGQGMAHLLGLARAQNIQYHVPNTSSLLAANTAVIVQKPGQQPEVMRPLYGYVMQGPGPRDPRVPEGSKIGLPNQPVGQLGVDTMPRNLMPRGADIGDQPVSVDGQPVPVEANA